MRGTLAQVTRRALTAPPAPAAPPCAVHAKEGAPRHGVAHLAWPLWPPAAHTRPPRRPPRRRHLRPLQGRHPAARRPQRPRAQPVRGKTYRTTRLHGPHALTGGDLGESFAIILVRTGPYGAWLRHPAIQRARDSGHAAPRAPRARDELAPLALRALLSCKQLSTKVPGRFYSTLYFRYRIHLYGRRVHSCFTWPK